ncbi:MAG TPA: hypothetical protein VGS41_18765, partial [Chthonomonadales bacterium]|nr:hypothetical protein [Chthonomonadales bacterium]
MKDSAPFNRFSGNGDPKGRCRLALMAVQLLPRLPITALVILPLLSLCLAGAWGQNGAFASADQEGRLQEVAYELTPVLNGPNPTLKVSIDWRCYSKGTPVSLQMPVWAPGDYHVQNFGGYVRSVSARSGNLLLRVLHPDKNTWTVTPPADAETVTLTYTLPPEPPGYFSENVQLTKSLVFLNGPSVYMYLVGEKQRPARVTVHNLPQAWVVASALKPVSARNTMDHSFTAPDYDTLADSPIVMAPPDAIAQRSFTMDNIRH